MQPLLPVSLGNGHLRFSTDRQAENLGRFAIIEFQKCTANVPKFKIGGALEVPADLAGQVRQRGPGRDGGSSLAGGAVVIDASSRSARNPGKKRASLRKMRKKKRRPPP